MITKPNYAKKLAGTTLLAISIVALVLTLSGRAAALFTFLGSDLTFSATVSHVDATSLTVDKGGTLPFIVIVDGATQYSGAYSALDDVSVGDHMLIEAREDQGMLLAEEIIAITPDTYGYGNACETFEGTEFWVSAIEDGEMWLSRSNVTFMVGYDNNTQVMPGEQSIQDVQIGETIAIVGDDCHGDGIVADTIVRNVLPPTNEVACSDLNGLVFSNATVLLSHDEGGAVSPYQDVDIPAGVYDIYGISFDNHSENPWDTLTNEAWYLEANSNDKLVYTSEPTNDLPDDMNRNLTKIGSAVAISEDIDQIRYIHNAFVDPTYQSITPECVAFEPLSDLSDDTNDDASSDDQPVILDDQVDPS